MRSHHVLASVVLAAFAAVSVSVSAGAAGATGPALDARGLPDVAAFTAEVRKRLQSDREVQSRFRYLERREEIRVNKLGKVIEGPVRLFEVHPSAEPGETYKRLIEVDGVPLSAEELAARDREHLENQRKVQAERLRETPAAREKRLREKARELKEEQDLLDEVFRTYDIRLVGRDTLDGHPVIVAHLDPRPGHRPRTDEGELMLKVRARAWVSETDYQIARLELDVFDDLTIGWGIIGRLHKGSRAIFERRRVEDGAWLPAKVTYIASGRSLLLHKFQIETVTEYSGYRRADAIRNSEFGMRN
jgi:hypothetical protein